MQHLRLEQEIGPYEAAAAASALTRNFYTSLARLLHCRSEEIAFVENATRAWDLAIHAVDWRPGDEIITVESEYASNYLGLLHLVKRLDLKLITIARDDRGLIDLEALRRSLGPRSRMIALNHVASQRGDIQPAAAVGSIAREHGLWYLLDVCQAVGQLDLDVEALGCDFLCGSGRKYLRGPRGTGFLYVRGSRLEELEPVFIDLVSARWQSPDEFVWQEGALRFENFERFVAGQIGLGVAVDYALDLGMTAIEARVRLLGERLREALAEIDGVSVLEQAPERAGIVTFRKFDEEATDLHARLLRAGCNSSVASAESDRLDAARRELGDINRASPHYYNTEEEIERFAAVVARA